MLRLGRVWAISGLAFASGLPSGFINIALPDALRVRGFDLRWIGLTTLLQLPWFFQFMIAPALDRLSGDARTRWIFACAVAQAALAGIFVAFAADCAGRAGAWIFALASAMALVASVHDIAAGAYAVESLRPGEHEVLGGFRAGCFRVATGVTGGLAITLAPFVGWPALHATYAGFLCLAAVATAFVPRPPAHAARTSWRAAVADPLRELWGRPAALRLLAFCFLFKIGDSLGGVLIRPFLIDLGYGPFDRGLVLAIGALGLGIVGTVAGGVLTARWGLRRALWIFGALQVISNLGYLVLASSGVHRPLLFAVIAFEHASGGLGAAALAALVLRATAREFSAAQYALFASLSLLPGLLAGPIGGVLAQALGWTPFFWIAFFAGIPGLLVLQRGKGNLIDA